MMFNPSAPIISETVSAAAVSVLLPALAAFFFLFLRKRAGKRGLRLLLLISLALLPAAAESVRAQNDTTCSIWTEVNTWDGLQGEINNGVGCIRLIGDITAGDGDSYLSIRDRTVTLDLNGKILDRGLMDSDPVDDGYVIRIEWNGSLTLTGSGTITGGNNTGHGGGVYVKEFGIFTMHGGTISGNTANGFGGGVYNSGVFTMNDGTISGNTADFGGGVYNYGIFTMNDGTISGNTTAYYGGGVCNTGTLNISGSPVIRDNSLSEKPNNVLLVYEDPINVDGELEEGASIGISMRDPGVFTSGLSNKGNASNFFSDDPNYTVGLTTDGKAQLVNNTVPPDVYPPEPERRGIDFFRLHGDCELPATGFSSLRPTPLPEQPKDLRYEPAHMRLMIPALDREIELVTMPREGNSWAAARLGADAGILEGSALPGEGVSIIAAHNTLNDTDYGPFALLGTLDVNDTVMVREESGALKLFRVYANELLEPDDMERLAALAGDDALVLLTCENVSPAGGYLNRRAVFAR